MKHRNSRSALAVLRAIAAGLIIALPQVAAGADVTATWNSSVGNWSDATKWSSNPNFPNNGNGGFTFDAVQNSGTLTLDQAITIEKFTLTSGTQAGGGFNLTLNDLLTWSAGTLSGAGTIQADGGITMNVGAKTLSGRTMNNTGSANWTGGAFDTGQGAVFNNQVGATFTTNFDGAFNYDLGGVTTVFSNAGTFTKSGGTGTTSFTSVFNNSGTVNVNSGTLSLQGGGTQTGSFSLAAGAKVVFTSPAIALNTGAGFSGAGTAQITSGTVTVNNPVTIGSALELTSGTLTGAGTVTVSGPMTWTGGTIDGAGVLQADGGLTLSSGTKTLKSRTVNNSGAANWTGGSFDTGQGAVFNNQVGATFTTSFDGGFNYDLGGVTTVFSNAGTFTKSGGAGTTSFTSLFDNSGTVNVNSGTLSLQGGARRREASAWQRERRSSSIRWRSL